LFHLCSFVEKHHTEHVLIFVLFLLQATNRLPSAVDVSCCHLDYLPENLFVNTELELLNLRHNSLCEQPAVELVSNIGWLNSLTRWLLFTLYTHVHHFIFFQVNFGWLMMLLGDSIYVIFFALCCHSLLYSNISSDPGLSHCVFIFCHILNINI